jgi:phage terminase small subunit
VPRAVGLTEKQKRFVAEYLIDLNATAAARRAGYRGSHVDSVACHLLSKKQVVAAVRAAQAERSRRLQIDADAVLQEVAAIAFADIVEMTERGPRLLPTFLMSPGAGKAIASMKVRREPDGTETVEFRMHNKNEALRNLVRHLGLLKDTTVLEASNEAPLVFKQVVDVEPAGRSEEEASGI